MRFHIFTVLFFVILSQTQISFAFRPQTIDLKVYNLKWAAIQDRFNFTTTKASSNTSRDSFNDTTRFRAPYASVEDEVDAARTQMICTARFIDLVGTMCKQFLIQESMHYESAVSVGARSEASDNISSEPEDDTIPRVLNLHNVWNPPQSPISNRILKNRLKFIIPTAVIHTCCEASCNITSFIKYCQDQAASSSTTTMATNSGVASRSHLKNPQGKRLGTIMLINHHRRPHATKQVQQQIQEQTDDNSAPQIVNMRMWRNRMRLERQLLSNRISSFSPSPVSHEFTNHVWDNDGNNQWNANTGPMYSGNKSPNLPSSSTTTISPKTERAVGLSPSPSLLSLHQSFMTEFRLRPNQSEPEPIVFPIDITDVQFAP